MSVAFMRHGEAQSNIDGENGIVGSDKPLTRRGIEQVRATSEWMLGRLAVSRIISSPYRRTLETSEIVAERLGVEVTTDERLREIDKGDWTGRPVPEVMRLEDAVDSTDRPLFRPPNGENWLDVGRRVVALVADLRNNEATDSLLVSHDHPIRMGIGLLLYKPIADWEQVAIANASVTRLYHAAGSWHADPCVFNRVGYEGGEKID